MEIINLITNKNKIDPIITQLVNIWERSVRNTHHFLKEEDISYFRTKLLTEYMYIVKIFYVIDKYNNIYGFFGINNQNLEMLFVDSMYIRQGIGGYMLKYMIQQFNVANVDVNIQNINAINFYLKHNFKVIKASHTDSLGKPYPILHMSVI